MATPLLEGLNSTSATSALAAMPGSSSIATVQQIVTDCPAYAWDESDQPAVRDLRNTYGLDWVNRWRRDLDKAAYGEDGLIRAHLTAAWAKRGYDVVFLDDKSAYESLPADEHTPSDETYWAVWTEAADQITATTLVTAARLTEYAR